MKPTSPLYKALNNHYLVLLAFAVLLAVLPLVFPSSYYFRVAALVWVSGLTVIGLNLLMGYAGQVSLGHAGFFGIGAYAVAIMPVHLGIPPWLAFFAGLAIAGAIAYFVGRPILKLKGHYLAVATLGFGFLIAMIINNEAQWSGGPDGMTVQALGLKSALKSMGLKLKTAELWYWVSGIVMILGAWLAFNLVDSPTGRALRSLHDSEVAAQVNGIDVPRHKLIVFVISAVYAAAAGALLAFMNRFVTPDTAGFLHSVELVTMVVLGGMGSIAGSIVGAAVLVTLPQILADLHDYEHVFLGLIMMVFMIFLRRGIVPSLKSLIQGRDT